MSNSSVHIDAQKYAGNAFFSALGSVVNRAALFINIIIVAHMVTKDDLGVFTLLLSYGATVSTVARFGLSVAVCRFISSDCENRRDTVMTHIAAALIIWGVVSLVTLVAIACLRHWLASSVYQQPELSGLLILFGVYGIFQALILIAQFAAQGFRAFRSTGLANVAVATVWVTANAILVFLFGFRGAVLAALIGTGLGAGAMMFVVYRTAINVKAGSFWKWPSRSTFKALINFSIPVYACSLFFFPVGWLAMSVLANQSGFGEVGRFGAANIFRQGIGAIGAALAVPALPLLAPVSDRNDTALYAEGIVRTVRLSLIVVAFICCGVFAFPDLCMMVLGRQYIHETSVLFPQLIACILAAISGTFGTVLMTGRAGRVWIAALSNIIWAGTLLALGSYLATPHGAEGLAWAYVLSYVLVCTLQGAYLTIFLSRKVISLFIPIAIIAVLVWLSQWASHYQNILARSAILAGVWIAFGLVVLDGLERRMLKDIAQRFIKRFYRSKTG